MSDDSDGVEIVEKEAAGSSRSRDDTCQLCPTNFHGLSEAERQDHYDRHPFGQFVGPQTAKRGRRKPASAVTPQRKSPILMKLGKGSERVAQEDVFWYPTQAAPPPDNYSPGVLSILKEALKQSHNKGATQRACLCYERTPHILRESFDTKWGCGYRNFMMACAALMGQQLQTQYFPCLNDPLPPGIRNLQHWLEDAWKQGYDDIGALDFEHKLVDTQKKLGTGDLYVAFTFRKIPCALVDFNLRKSPKGFDALTEWVVNYFTEKPEGNINQILRAASPIVATNKMPIIMQYDGHSMTIVGYERAKSGKYTLLVFDPSSRTSKGIRQAGLNGAASVGWTSSSPGKCKRRDRSTSPCPKKRSRTNQDDGRVSIPDSEDEMGEARQAVALRSTLDADMVIKAFRMKPNKNKHEYQLLYFTMGDPLSDEEQDNRKVVLSVSEC